MDRFPSPPCNGCDSCESRLSGVFSGLDADSLQLLDGAKTSHRYRRGQALFYEGNPPTAVFCVRSGMVKVWRSAPHDRRYVLDLAGPGDVLGLEALLANRPHHATAEMVAEGSVCLIESRAIQRLAETRPTAQRALIELLAERVQRSESERAELASGDVRERTALALLSLAARWGQREDGAVVLDLSLTREELAGLIGATPETTIRQLGDLRKKGVLTTDGKRITLLDTGRLARLARRPVTADDVDRGAN